jgi:hypothetical protein
VIFDHPYNGGYTLGCNPLVDDFVCSASELKTNCAPVAEARRPALGGADLIAANEDVR